MWPLFRHQLSRLRGTMLGWGIPLALLAGYLMPFYANLSEERELLEQLMQVYPKELLVFFGGDALDAMFTPEGFIHVELFSYLPLLLGIFALLTGSGLISGDEERGLLDLFLSLPVSRTRFFLARVAAFLVATTVILAFVWGGLVAGQMITDFPLKAGRLALPVIDLFSLLLVVGSLALALSQMLPSRRSAAMLTGLIIVASFFLNGLAELNEDLVPVARLLPLYYTQGGMAITDGLRADWLFGKLAAAALLFGLDWWRFVRRDVRVSGEGTWPRPWHPLRRRGRASASQKQLGTA